MGLGKKPSVGLVGSGPVALGLATLLTRAGYRATVGTRHPEARKLASLPAGVTVGDFRDAALRDIVVISVRHAGGRIVVPELRHELTGKVVVDTMNAWIREDYVAAGFSDELTEGTWLARLIPNSKVARAYSHIDGDLLVPRATEQPGVWAAGYAADDAEAVKTVEQLIRDSGYVPVRIGTLAQSAPLDPGGALWARMFTPQQMRHELARHRSAR